MIGGFVSPEMKSNFVMKTRCFFIVKYTYETKNDLIQDNSFS